MKNVRNYSTGPGGSTLLYVVMDVTPLNLDIAVVQTIFTKLLRREKGKRLGRGILFKLVHIGKSEYQAMFTEYSETPFAISTFSERGLN